MIPPFLTDDVKAQIVTIANNKPTEEVCGLILSDGTVIEAENIIEKVELEYDGDILNLSTGYAIAQDLIDEHDGNIACVFHSHHLDTQEGYLSYADIEQSRFHQISYLLYHTEFKTWDLFDPTQYHPFPLKETGSPLKLSYYLNWPFIFGRSDCASLLLSYFHNMCGYDIQDYPRPPHEDWYRHEEYQQSYVNLFQDPANGFVQINTSHPKKNDVVLMRFFGSKYPCHIGIIVEEGKMLHLLQPQHLSEIVVWGGAWARGLHSVWRLAE
jgi:proteasome lid subunit RPN8/RPN11